MRELKLDITGRGSRKDLSDALKLLADHLYSPDLEEIYNIDGAEYNDCCITVQLKDEENG